LFRVLTEKSVEALAESEAEYTLLLQKFNMITFHRPEETGMHKLFVLLNTIIH